MRSINAAAMHSPRGHLLCTVIGLCVALAGPAPAQEGAAAAIGDASQAGSAAPGDGAVREPLRGGAAGAPGDIELAAPRHDSGLWRRANVKALIATAPGKGAGSPAAATRIAPPLPDSINVPASRNAVGVALPSPRPGPGIAAVTSPAGPRLTGIGSTAGAGIAAGSTGNVPGRMPTPANLAVAPHGAAIDGTAMRHTATGPGSIGGPARERTGINGTLMRPRH